jgi:hypothetical protein
MARKRSRDAQSGKLLEAQQTSEMEHFRKQARDALPERAQIDGEKTSASSFGELSHALLEMQTAVGMVGKLQEDLPQCPQQQQASEHEQHRQYARDALLEGVTPGGSAKLQEFFIGEGDLDDGSLAVSYEALESCRHAVSAVHEPIRREQHRDGLNWIPGAQQSCSQLCAPLMVCLCQRPSACDEDGVEGANLESMHMSTEQGKAVLPQNDLQMLGQLSENKQLRQQAVDSLEPKQGQLSGNEQLRKLSRDVLLDGAHGKCESVPNCSQQKHGRPSANEKSQQLGQPLEYEQLRQQACALWLEGARDEVFAVKARTCRSKALIEDRIPKLCDAGYSEDDPAILELHRLQAVRSRTILLFWSFIGFTLLRRDKVHGASSDPCCAGRAVEDDPAFLELHRIRAVLVERLNLA